MTREEIETRVIAVLSGIQEKTTGTSGPVDGRTCPLRDLPQFDSLLALEASVEIESELDCASEENLFVDERTSRPLRVEEIVDRLCARVQAEESHDAR
jgi:acyl carrier protein